MRPKPARRSISHPRLFLLLFILCSLLTLAHLFLPTPQSPPTPYSNSHLLPKNYLNTTDFDPHPFSFCPAYGPGDAIGRKYGALLLGQSRMHLGSGARIRKVIDRALGGHPIVVSIIGGSVSACHGAGDDPISPKCYPSLFFKWWNSVFPHPATELTNGAMRRTASSYFGFCSTHHIPDAADLIIVELDTDDQPDPDMMENFELLIRSSLLRPDQPAVLLLGHFSPQIHKTYGYVGPDHLHNAVAQFYDLPHISTKSLLFSDYMNDPGSVSKHYADPVLASPSGHQLLADVLIAYFQSQICAAWDVAVGDSYDGVPYRAPDVGEHHGLFGGVGQRKGVPEPGSEDEILGDVDAEGNRIRLELPASSNIHQPLLHVPPGRINTRPSTDRPFEEIAPYCVSANDLINPLPPSLFYGSGWYAYHPSSGNSAMNVKSHYWYSTLPTSKLRIPLQVGAGDIGIFYLKEPITAIGEGSAVECWVDDNYAGAKVIENAGDVGESTPTLTMVDHHVTRGSHFVECQLLGEEGSGVPAFKIIGIFST